MDEARRKARLRLLLRAERAMGASGVPLKSLKQRGRAGSTAPAASAPTSQPARAAAAARSAVAAAFRRPSAAPAAAQTARPAPAPPATTAAGLYGGTMADPDAPFTSAPLPPEQKRLALQQMDEQEVRGCTRCRLCEKRTNTVFGEGDPEARIFFIGEGPGESEDLQGRPFVGRAGQLLDKMIAGMGLKREQVFIANIVKCRPPGNREPAPDEVATCTPYLERQLEIVRPRVIVTLGRPASQYMLKTKLAMGKLRGRWHSWRGIKVMPTFHPAYILRNYTPETRRAVWDDLRQVMAEVGLTNARGKQGDGA